MQLKLSVKSLLYRYKMLFSVHSQRSFYTEVLFADDYIYLLEKKKKRKKKGRKTRSKRPMTLRYAMRNGYHLNSREKFVQLEFYKSLLVNGGRFVYYEQADDEWSEQK